MTHKYQLPDYLFFTIIILVSIFFYKILSPFILDIFLAMILAHLFYKQYLWQQKKLRINTTGSAILVILTILIIIIVPLIFVGTILTTEASTAYIYITQHWTQLQELFSREHLQDWLKHLPLSDLYINQVQRIDVQKPLIALFSTGAQLLFNAAQGLFVNLAFSILHLALTLLLTFFMIMDGAKLLSRIFYLSPLNDAYEKELINDVVRIVDATLIGNLIVGIIEGSIGGIIFALCGIPSAVFWAVVMVVMSLLPVLGINGILIPTGIYFIISGAYIQGILMIAVGYGCTTVTQNYLKPMLISGRGGLHPAIILLSTIGGLTYLGVAGFLIGPVSAAIFVSLWNQFGRRYHQDLDTWNAEG